MTKIGPNPPPVDAVKAFIENAGKVVPTQNTGSADDFHEALESARKRSGHEAIAKAKIGEKDSGHSAVKPSFDTLDPEIQRKLRDGGYEPPKP